METTTCTSEKDAAEGMMMQQQRQEQEQAMVEAEKKQMKVMVAIDESEGSFHALKWTLDHLFFFFSSAGEAEPTQNQEQGKVILLHVQEPFHHYIVPVGPGTIYATYVTSSVLEPLKKAREQNSAALLACASKLCNERRVKAETMVLEGEPKEMICQAAEQIQPTLLVVGSRGLGKIKRAFLGSVSDYCAHHAKCPILIVKPPK